MSSPVSPGPFPGIGAVVFFGPPGAGKGTQARTLQAQLGVAAISTGDMIRSEASSETPQGAEFRRIMARGELVSDEQVNRLVERRLREPDCRRGFVLDGYPRTTAQARALQTMLASNGTGIRLIHFRIPPEEAVRRITGRRLCPTCGTIYNLHWHPPRDPERCDRDQTRLQIRPDDREEVVRERLRVYEEQTRPVVEYFRQRGQTIHELDATRPGEEVAAQLSRILSPEK